MLGMRADSSVMYRMLCLTPNLKVPVFMVLDLG
jgi:hypothetical protein